ncbi:MAG: hypothetical protein IT236_04555, partial [Bacteroidia bacterium]|nr:hypothetical protein [Bacteroidia bacterium]
MFKKLGQDDRWKLSFETGFFTFNTISKKQGTYHGGFLRSNFTGEIYDKYKYNFSFIKPSFSYSLINPNKTSLSFHIGVTSYFNYKVSGYSFEKNQTNGAERQID